MIYIKRDPSSDEFQLLGALEIPKVTTDYPCRYFVSLDDSRDP